MSRWEWYESPPKQPVPADGLRVDRFGDSWWGAQWLSSLQRLSASFANRLPRGRSYARAGRVVDLAIGAGIVTAGVVGTRTRPYRVELTLATFGDEQWRRVVAELASEARFTVSLLRGELPPEVGERLESIGAELFPSSVKELSTTCSCPDWANPCKHVAAVFYVVAAALDADPFLAFVLRGLDRTGLLAALAETRGGGASSLRPAAGGTAPGPEAPDPWEQPEAIDEVEYLGSGQPGPRLSFRIAAPEVVHAGLRRLGEPPPQLQRLPQRLGATISRAGTEAVQLAGEGLPAKGPDEPGAAAEPGPAAARRTARPARSTKPRGRTKQRSMPSAPASGTAGHREEAPKPAGTTARETRRPRRRAPSHAHAGPAPAPPEDPLEAAICQVLARHPRGASRTTLSRELHQPFASLGGAIQSLRKAGRVEVSGSGIGVLLRLSPARDEHSPERPRRRAAGKRTHTAPSGRGRPRTSGTAASAPASDLAGRVVALLEARGLSMSARQIASVLRVDTDTLRPVLLRLRRESKVVMIGQRRGARYRLPR